MMPELTRDNYYGPEANREYMSHSQYQDFLSCEAMAIAKLRGEWAPEGDTALLVGSYIHAWNEGCLEEFKQKHPEMFTKKGELYAQFRFADQMIATLANDPMCMFALEGQKEVIMTAEMFGVPWKIRIDVYGDGRRRIVDLKSTRSINGLVWSDERWAKVSFIDAYNYPRQMAIYCEVERIATGNDNWAEPLIVAVSKEEPPDKGVISLVDERRFAAELHGIKENMPRILAVKNGTELPKGCGKCAYCRATKKVTKVIHYTEIGA